MTAATATPEMPASLTPSGVNLDDVERGMRNASGTDLTEAKEAVVEALLQLAVQRCTGEGSAGEFIFAVKPSAKLVSGLLLPRFDATGQGDETSDIHLATMESTCRLRPTIRARSRSFRTSPFTRECFPPGKS
jgi:hypothetical protein